MGPSATGDFAPAEEGSAGDHPSGTRQHARASPPLPVERALALIEVLLCSGFPTQVVLSVILAVAGFRPLDPDGRLSATWVITLSLLDAALVVGLALWFMRVHGERPRAVLLGTRPLVREGLVGLPLTLAALVLVVAVVSLVRYLAPWLHNVERNPMQEMIRTSRDAWAFGIVGVVAGGLREEIQRAFVLHRFGQFLGGPWVGLVLFSVAFGSGHLIQGWDVALATGSLGVLWGLVYLRRRSIAAPVVSHAGFNAAEVIQFALLGLHG